MTFEEHAAMSHGADSPPRWQFSLRSLFFVTYLAAVVAFLVRWTWMSRSAGLVIFCFVAGLVAGFALSVLWIGCEHVREHWRCGKASFHALREWCLEALTVGLFVGIALAAFAAAIVLQLS